MSWRETLLARLEDNWAETKAASFYDGELHSELRRQISTLLKFCPETRQLVHGDYGFDNLLSDGVCITGVIDWEMSMYGDFLYDVAWLDRWNPNHDYEALFKAYYSSQNRLPENYEQRLRCYRLCIALDSLSFYAYSRQPSKYQDKKDFIVKSKDLPWSKIR